jgi:hypothetical protein
MQVSTTINMGGVLAALNKAQLKPRNTKRALKMAALKQVEVIGNRTEKGEGLNGAFEGYSDIYSKMIIERRFGKKNKPKGSKDPYKVNLFYSGRMLANLGVVKSTSNFALVSFRSFTERKKAKANQRTRPFMGIKREEQADIMRIFKRELFK